MADTDNHFRAYCKNVLKITQISDFWNRDTNRPFTRNHWRKFVKQLHTEWYGVEPDNHDIITKGDKIYDIQQQIPRPILVQLLRQYTTRAVPKKRVYLIRANISWPAVIVDNRHARRVKIDAVGKAHLLPRLVEHQHYTIVSASMWKGKWAGPKGQSYATDVEWNFYGISKLQDITISAMTTRKAHYRMKPPQAETTWPAKLNQTIKFSRTWKLRHTFATPRDATVVMQVQRRNLWVAKNGGLDSPKCAVHECNEDENQLHLVTCIHINQHFWTIIHTIIEDLGLKATNDARFWITGQLTSDTSTKKSHADPETWSIVCWAWRSLYAETVKCHMENKRANLKYAVFSTVRYMVSRSKAYGLKWRLWYIKQSHHSKFKEFPLRHRTHAMIQLTNEAEFTIDTRLLAWFEWARDRTKT